MIQKLSDKICPNGEIRPNGENSPKWKKFAQIRWPSKQNPNRVQCHTFEGTSDVLADSSSSIGWGRFYETVSAEIHGEKILYSTGNYDLIWLCNVLKSNIIIVHDPKKILAGWNLSKIEGKNWFYTWNFFGPKWSFVKSVPGRRRIRHRCQVHCQTKTKRFLTRLKSYKNWQIEIMVQM
jgi:hypothetical protein